MEYVYVIRTGDWTNKYYIGVTADVEKRVEEHNAGTNASTKGTQWTLVYVEGYVKRSYAFKRERSLKKDRRVWRHVKERIEKSLE